MRRKAREGEEESTEVVRGHGRGAVDLGEPSCRVGPCRDGSCHREALPPCATSTRKVSPHRHLHTPLHPTRGPATYTGGSCYGSGAHEAYGGLPCPPYISRRHIPYFPTRPITQATGALAYIRAMATEFSLLTHLGVQVPEATAVTTAPPAQGLSAVVGPHHAGHFRVLAPSKRPPQPREAPTDRNPSRHLPPPPQAATIAGEVLIPKGGGAEYVIYDSLVPSTQGVNLQLMEQKRQQKQRQRGRSEAHHQDPNGSASFFLGGPGDLSVAARQRQVLAELQQHNMEQARRRKEEQQRAAAARCAQERAWLQEAQQESAHEAEQRRLQRRAASTEARDNASRLRSRQQDDTAVSQQSCYEWESSGLGALSALSAAREEASVRRDRETMEANRRIADSRSASRSMMERHARDAAAAAAAALQQSTTEAAEGRAASRRAKQQMLDELRGAAEASAHRKQQQRERERQTAGLVWEVNTADHTAGVSVLPSGSERDHVQRLKLRTLQAENARLAAERKTSRALAAQREAEADRVRLQEARALLDAEEAKLRAQRRQQGEELQRAAEEAIASRREQRRREREHDAAPSSAGLLSDRDAGGQSVAAKRAYYEELLEQIEAQQQRAARDRQATMERQKQDAAELTAVAAAMKASEQHSRRVARLQYRHALDAQVAQQRETIATEARTPRPGGADGLERRVGPQRRILLRCPVTHQLLPPTEFDLPARHRASHHHREQVDSLLAR